METYRVLIVEDDFRVANIWKEFTLTMDDFIVSGTVNSGKDAQDHLKRESSDLLIMDVYMPDIDGVELLREIRGLGLPLDVIAITAAKESKIVQRILRMGVVDYIIKPCSLERFQLSLTRFKQLRATFENEEVEQSELDQLLPWKTNYLGNSRNLPKGMQELTMKKILRCFENNPYARSAEEIAKVTGVSLATAQRYLRYLADNDLIKKELTYGSQGRPEHKYSMG